MRKFEKILKSKNELLAKLKTESCTPEFKKMVSDYVCELVHEIAISHDQLYYAQTALENQLNLTEQQIKLLTTPIDELLSTRACRCLGYSKTRIVSDLITMSKSDIREGKVPFDWGFGPVTKQEILNLLEELEKQGLPIKE